MSDIALLTHEILDKCKHLGFALAGVCEAYPSDFTDFYHEWIIERKHGEMKYLERNIDLRLDPGLLMPGAKSIICIADRYWTESKTSQVGDSEIASGKMGKIARYARGDDYHKVMKQRLRFLCDELHEIFPTEEFRACVDTAPVMEREHAQRAGLGSIGKNTLLLEQGVGSYFFLGEIITTLSLTPSKPAETDPCGSCTRCIDACPTEAISPWSVDATRCISYLTIEHRSEIDPAFHSLIGDWIFGCDICQEVCPHNQPTEVTVNTEINPSYEEHRSGFDLLKVIEWTEEERCEAFIKSSMKRANLEMMKRNAKIALNNSNSHNC